MKIVVIGVGYVGLVSSACFAELGHEVMAVDNDSEKVKLLSAGKVPIHEHLLPELVHRHLDDRLRFSDDIGSAVRPSDVVFITVGTPPSPNGEADLSYVEGVAREVARSLNGRKVVVEKSTVPVRTCEALQRSMVLNGADRNSFNIASNPEFLREGTAVSDFLYPDRIVIGVDCPYSAEALKEIYAPLTDGSYYMREDAIPGPWNRSARQIVTSVRSAELIKHASNAFLAMKISFINAVANVCEGVGAHISQVCEGIGSDSRIGSKFLVPGIGYGGSCFPKDVQAFRSVAKAVGYDFELLSAVMAVNEEQQERFVDKVRSDSRQRHRPLDSAAACDVAEDLPSTHTVGNASHPVLGLHGRARDTLADQVSSVGALHGYLSKRHLHFFKELLPLRLRKANHQPGEA